MRGLVLTILVVGCDAPKGATALHDLHQPTAAVSTPTLTDDFYTLPFPNPLHDRSDGLLDLSRYPRLGGALSQWVEQMDGATSGAGLSTAIYFRFDAAIAPDSVDGSVYLVDITPGSPEYGQHRPIATKYSELGGQFIGPHWLAMQPLGGFPLRESTTYAAILTSGLKAKDGGAVHLAKDLEDALAGRSSNSRVAVAYAPLIAWLASQPSERARLAGATLFTTQDATGIMKKLRQAVYDQPAPVLADLKSDGEDVAGVDQVYEGTFASPNFMSGDAPYMTLGSGAITLDGNGAPAVQRTETLRVAITVPEGAMPAAGWPVIIYAHGHNGSYKQIVDLHFAGPAANVKDGNGDTLARFAMIGVDQPLHGPRDPSGGGSNPELGFYIFQGNITAGRAVHKQSAADEFQLMRLVKSLNLASAPSTGQPIRFDPDRIYSFGYSQGSSTSGMFVALEPDVKAAVFAGAGGSLLLDFFPRATVPINLSALFAGFLQDDVDRFHPMFNLLQAFFTDSDEESYARLLILEPPAAPKSVFMPMGIGDHYVSDVACGDWALAAGLQPVNPMLAPIANYDGVFAGLPISNNLAAGKATGAVAQYAAAAGKEAHFVLLDVPAVGLQLNRFLATHAATGIATLSAP